MLTRSHGPASTLSAFNLPLSKPRARTVGQRLCVASTAQIVQRITPEKSTKVSTTAPETNQAATKSTKMNLAALSALITDADAGSVATAGMPDQNLTPVGLSSPARLSPTSSSTPNALVPGNEHSSFLLNVSTIDHSTATAAKSEFERFVIDKFKSYDNALAQQQNTIGVLELELANMRGVFNFTTNINTDNDNLDSVRVVNHDSITDYRDCQLDNDGAVTGKAETPVSVVRLFVQNVSYATSYNDLLTFFGQYGNVISIRMPTHRTTHRPRGIAFVTFSQAAFAQQAIEQANGQQLDGRQLRVFAAREYVKKFYDEVNVDKNKPHKYADDVFAASGSTGRHAAGLRQHASAPYVSPSPNVLQAAATAAGGNNTSFKNKPSNNNRSVNKSKAQKPNVSQKNVSDQQPSVYMIENASFNGSFRRDDIMRSNKNQRQPGPYLNQNNSRFATTDHTRSLPKPHTYNRGPNNNNNRTGRSRSNPSVILNDHARNDVAADVAENLKMLLENPVDFQDFLLSRRAYHVRKR